MNPVLRHDKMTVRIVHFLSNFPLRKTRQFLNCESISRVIEDSTGKEHKLVILIKSFVLEDTLLRRSILPSTSSGLSNASEKFNT